jgi:hypothetical protein
LTEGLKVIDQRTRQKAAEHNMPPDIVTRLGFLGTRIDETNKDCASNYKELSHRLNQNQVSINRLDNRIDELEAEMDTVTSNLQVAIAALQGRADHHFQELERMDKNQAIQAEVLKAIQLKVFPQVKPPEQWANKPEWTPPDNRKKKSSSVFQLRAMSKEELAKAERDCAAGRHSFITDDEVVWYCQHCRAKHPPIEGSYQVELPDDALSIDELAARESCKHRFGYGRFCVDCGINQEEANVRESMARKGIAPSVAASEIKPPAPAPSAGP